MSDQEQAVQDETLRDPGQGHAPAVVDDVLPDTLYLIPNPVRPFFPGQLQPVLINPQEWGDTLQAVAKTGGNVIGLSYVSREEGEALDARQFPAIGCVVRLHQPQPGSGAGPGQFLAQGLRRFRIVRWLNDKPPYLVQVDYPRSQGDRESDEVKAYTMALIQQIKELLPLNPLYNEELKHYLANFNPNQPSLLADFSAALTTAPAEDLQEILDTLPLLSRMDKSLTLLRKEREVAELQGRITSQVNEKVSDHQREFFLREQLKVIQKELGISKDDRTSDVEMFRERIADKTLPETARGRIEEELHKLSVLETGSPEYGVTRNYLDWATQVPWGVNSRDNLELAHARGVLNEQHSGLEDVKDRILEF
ncbi:MAG: LON peptidase substrate-binding domain-containing protein, partial [Parahaliea sp.]